MNNKAVKMIKLDGANMDIDLTSNEKDINWQQDGCPWNIADGTDDHKCAVKNISVCPFFCGIEYQDNVLCCYPNKNPNKGSE